MKDYGVFLFWTLLYITVLVVLFSKNFSLQHKTWIIFIIFYFLGTVLLFLVGFFGGGYVWLFGASLIVGVIIGTKAAGIAILFNFLSLFSIGVYLAVGSPDWASGIENVIGKWVVLSGTFILINTMVTLLVAIMLNSLKTALTRERNTAIELKRKHEELIAIFTASPDPVIVYDSLDRIQYLNDAFTGTFGWTLNEVEEKNISFIPEGQRIISANDYLSGTGKVKNTEVRFETIRQTKDGKLLNVSLSAAPIKGNRGDTIGIVVNMRDITELKKKELNLQQSQKMESIGILAGSIAHDFNNILFPILGYTEMLLNDVSDDSLFRSKLEGIYSAALRARDLVTQILEFSHKENSELILTKIQPIIKEALK